MTLAARRSLVLPVVIALAVGIGSLGPFLGVPSNSRTYRLVLLVGLTIASVLWIATLRSIATTVLRVTVGPYTLRATNRADATAAGKPYLLSGDPAKLIESWETVTGIRHLSIYRHPIRRFKWWKQRRQILAYT